MQEYPDYCPDDLKEDEVCSACGASPETGICRARYNKPKPKPLLEFVLVDKKTEEIVARQTVLWK